ncbi:hypothetical protein ACFQZE_14645 [Paenibacillus sp. GCM10027627]|uniref:hypothetical protein n=1 Tax=unclassified Paenibacillus TaxID=185978 RepID=UPI00362FE051
MKKLHIVLLVASIVLLSAACGKSGSGGAGENVTAINEVSVATAQGAKGGVENESFVEIDKGLFSDTITKQLSAFEGLGLDEIIVQTKKEGTSVKTKDKNGVPVYKMTLAAYQDMLGKMERASSNTLML